jgi:UDP-glucose 4-epimerase
LLEATKGNPVKKFVYASSSSIYGDAERLPTGEETVPSPVSPYGATKLLAENLCHVYFKSYSVPSVILRYFTVYGPRQRPDMAFNIFIARILHGEELEIFGDGEQSRDFTYVGDIVEGTILAGGGEPGSTYNIGSGRSSSLNSVISTIESIIGRKAKVRRSGKAMGDVRNTSADIARISKDLDFKPSISLRKGLERQIEAQRKSFKK